MIIGTDEVAMLKDLDNLPTSLTITSPKPNMLTLPKALQVAIEHVSNDIIMKKNAQVAFSATVGYYKSENLWKSNDDIVTAVKTRFLSMGLEEFPTRLKALEGKRKYR